MSKSVLLSCLVVSLLLISSCSKSVEESSDLELISKNLDLATQMNHDVSNMATFDIKSFLVENTNITVERKDKLQKLIDKIALIEKGEKKSIELIDKQISEVKNNPSLKMDDINTSITDFLKVINQNIENNTESEGVLTNIKSVLNAANYKLDGSELNKILSLKSIKLSVSNAYYLSISYLKSTVSLRSQSDLEKTSGL
jgi:hypothetical protein